MKRTGNAPAEQPRDLAATLRYWRHGVRLYIALASGLASVEIWLWAHAAYSNNQTLALIRAQELYAWLAVTLVAIALAIGPAYKLFPGLPYGGQLRDARRLIGVSAAWFACMHVLIAYSTQFGGSGADVRTTILNRPTLAGLAALVMLLALAFTSFDAAFRGMGVWWFRLHRLIYGAGLLALLHAFMIGTHATNLWPLMIICGVAFLLVIFHICVALRRPQASRWQWLTIIAVCAALVLVGNYGVQRYTDRLVVSSGGHQHK